MYVLSETNSTLRNPIRNVHRFDPTSIPQSPTTSKLFKIKKKVLLFLSYKLYFILLTGNPFRNFHIADRRYRKPFLCLRNHFSNSNHYYRIEAKLRSIPRTNAENVRAFRTRHIIRRFFCPLKFLGTDVSPSQNRCPYSIKGMSRKHSIVRHIRSIKHGLTYEKATSYEIVAHTQLRECLGSYRSVKLIFFSP